MVPDYLIDLFTKTSTIHNYGTRHLESWHSRSQIVIIVKIILVTWNDLLSNMKNMGLLSTFKRALVTNSANIS